ncbi:MAG: hypothetical protein PHD15_00560 [Clostridia bacterium]|nr:hypothetical protein [Clostridia bacterium]MDD4386242.1 hypothetical protein [Clostridia bacterium]
MNILINVDAFKVTGNELGNLAKTNITKFITANIGREVLPDLIEIKNHEAINKRNDGYDDNII